MKNNDIPKLGYCLILLPMWPLLSFIVKNKNEANFDISWVIITIFATAIILMLMYGVFKFICSKQFAFRLISMVSVFLCYVQFYYDIKNILFKESVHQQSLAYFFILGFCLCLLVWFAAKTKFVLIMGFFAVTCISFPIFNLIHDSGILTCQYQSYIKSDSYNCKNLTGNNHPSNRLVNVYYFVFDAYLRSDMLKQYYSFDNDPFIRDIESKGYRILRKCRSNFPVTKYSLNYVLNPSLSNSEYTKLPKILANKTSYYGAESSEIFTKFQNLEYTCFMMNYSDMKYKTDGINFIINDKDTIPFSRLQFYKTLPVYDILETYFPGLLWSWLKAHNADNRVALNKLSKVNCKPLFLFSHVLLPHPPYALCPDCSLNTKSVIDFEMEHEEDVQLWRERYLDQVDCANIQMLDIADRLNRDDPDAIVFFVSDHGWKGYYSENKPANEDEFQKMKSLMRVSNLIICKMPEKYMNYCEDNLTLVNTFPLIFACLENTLPTYIENRVFCVSRKKEITEITGITQ